MSHWGNVNAYNVYFLIYDKFIFVSNICGLEQYTGINDFSLHGYNKTDLFFFLTDLFVLTAVGSLLKEGGAI